MIAKRFLFFFLILIAVTACGRKSALQQLDPNGYPHPYPAPTTEKVNQNT